MRFVLCVLALLGLALAIELLPRQLKAVPKCDRATSVCGPQRLCTKVDVKGGGESAFACLLRRTFWPIDVCMGRVDCAKGSSCVESASAGEFWGVCMRSKLFG